MENTLPVDKKLGDFLKANFSLAVDTASTAVLYSMAADAVARLGVYSRSVQMLEFFKSFHTFGLVPLLGASRWLDTSGNGTEDTRAGDM